MSVFVLGSINTDLVIRGPRLPQPGETILGGEFYQAAGGKGANQAVAAARSIRPDEPKVVFLAAVGDDDFGRQGLTNLAQEHLDRSQIKIVPGCASGIAVILVDAKGENCISVASGANLHLRPEDVAAVPEELFRRCKVFLASLESSLETVHYGLKRAKELGLTTILNPAPVGDVERIKAMLPLVDLLTPNEHELLALIGTNTEPSASVALAGRELQKQGCRSVIVTLGSQGIMLIAEDSSIHSLPASSGLTVRDTTGAGDAFCGSLAVALAEGKSLLDASRFAIIAAGISVTRDGAQPSLPRRAEIDALAAQS